MKKPDVDHFLKRKLSYEEWAWVELNQIFYFVFGVFLISASLSFSASFQDIFIKGMSVITFMVSIISASILLLLIGIKNKYEKTIRNQ